jgi:hypothetical protein
MDSSSRKIVAIVATLTIVILAVMAGNLYTNSGSNESTAALETPQPSTDSNEAAMAQDSSTAKNAGFSNEVPKSDDIPAINGEPSMVFENDNSPDASAETIE